MSELPMLLLDDKRVNLLLGEGEYKITNLTFEEAQSIIEMHDEGDVRQCFTNPDIETIIYNYLGINKRNFIRDKVTKMLPGQDAIAFKLYVAKSETQGIIKTEGDLEAMKIQNIYVFCQYIARIR